MEDEEEDEVFLEMCIEVSYTPTRSPRQIDAKFIYKKTNSHGKYINVVLRSGHSGPPQLTRVLDLRNIDVQFKA